jgi:cell division protein FtsI/penicillin-binding protein 2
MKSNDFFRYWVVGGALSVAGLIIFIWMIHIQTSDSVQAILDRGNPYLYIDKLIIPERGSIYDRWGHLLAGNREVYQVGAELNRVRDPQTIAMTVYSILGEDYVDYNQAIANLNLSIDWDKEKPGYVTLANSVPPEKIELLQAAIDQIERNVQLAPEKQRAQMPSVAGLKWDPYLQRSYPENTLGSNIIGFYAFRDTVNGSGYFGVEEKYNHLLSGTPLKVKIPVDPYEVTDLPKPPPGISLVLTIDREVQAMVEDVLDRAIEANGAESGTIIVYDPRSGELMAMASTPRLDPNRYWEYQDLFPQPTPYNRAVGSTYEPGSVFKVLTMAAGLDSGTVAPETSFLDTGTIVVGGIAIHNWNRGAWGPQDMTGCMQHSLNVCMAWIATEMGPTQFYNYMQRFGIGHKTGIDLAGEANWPLTLQGDALWYPINLGTNSFGQGVAVTPIQMVMAVGALANDGKMMAPHILKAVIDDGEQFNNPPQVVGSPITANTARTVSEMLANSLEEESSVALVEGYRVSGKTGTAEIPGPGGYSSDRTNASFVGWGPTDSPRFLVYIWLEKPSTSIWGSVVAAPVFSEIVSKLVVLLDLPPDAIRQQMINQ